MITTRSSASSQVGAHGGTCPRDRRAFLVHPTDSGRAAKIAAVRILDEQQRRFLAPLSAAERRQLAALLTRLHRRPAPAE
jgi:DNA-binding MarR family transcriptional regulator